jgi:hypothetical protein
MRSILDAFYSFVEDTAMATAMQEKHYFLATDGTLVMEDAYGSTVCCRSGRIWLTQYGDSRDIVLKAGDCFQIDCGTVIVVQAMEAAQLDILPTAAAPLSARGWRDIPGRLLLRLLAPRWRAAANARMWTHNLPG